jgi:hypothetical protein
MAIGDMFKGKRGKGEENASPDPLIQEKHATDKIAPDKTQGRMAVFSRLL